MQKLILLLVCAFTFFYSAHINAQVPDSLSVLDTNSINTDEKNVVMDCTPTQKAQQVFENQKSNQRFYDRVLNHWDPSWASPPSADLGSEKGSYIMSADIQPLFTIGGEKLRPVFFFTPRYMVRIFRDNPAFNDKSFPVRTPSFMPGGGFFYPFRRIKAPYQNVEYLSVKFFHHSNGQDGAAFNTDGSYNTHNGNFATNFIEVGLNFSWRDKIVTTDTTFCSQCSGLSRESDMKSSYYDYFAKVAYQQHFMTADSMIGIYGEKRVNLKLGFMKVINHRWKVKEDAASPWSTVGDCYHKELFRITADASMIVDNLEGFHNDFERRINFELSAYIPFLSGNTAFFVTGGYYGSDPYNVYFEKKYFFVRAGLALGNFIRGKKTSRS